MLDYEQTVEHMTSSVPTTCEYLEPGEINTQRVPSRWMSRDKSGKKNHHLLLPLWIDFFTQQTKAWEETKYCMSLLDSDESTQPFHFNEC